MSKTEWAYKSFKDEQDNKGMEKQEKEKITEAMKLCESRLRSFFSHLDEVLSKEEASKFKDFILANTFFAGGVFRSVLTDTPVNDIDLFFKSYSSVIEFKHLVMKQPVKVFKEVTPNGSYNFKPGKGPKISFTTRNYGDPIKILKRFDLTFNMHYYDMQTMEMKFDRDTFQKAGYLNPKCTDVSGAVARSLRFMNAGFKVDQSSIVKLLKDYWDPEDPFTLGSSGLEAAEKLALTKKVYTEADYFHQQSAKSVPSTHDDVLSGSRALNMILDPSTTVDIPLEMEMGEDEEDDTGF